jgi:hypothetical protein
VDIGLETRFRGRPSIQSKCLTVSPVDEAVQGLVR